jgi:hypothetical protein
MQMQSFPVIEHLQCRDRSAASLTPVIETAAGTPRKKKRQNAPQHNHRGTAAASHKLERVELTALHHEPQPDGLARQLRNARPALATAVESSRCRLV